MHSLLRLHITYRNMCVCACVLCVRVIVRCLAAGDGVELFCETFNRNVDALKCDKSQNWFKGVFPVLHAISKRECTAPTIHLLLSTISKRNRSNGHQHHHRQQSKSWTAGHTDVLLYSPLHEWGFFNSPRCQVLPTALIPLSFSVHCGEFLMVNHFRSFIFSLINRQYASLQLSVIGCHCVCLLNSSHPQPELVTMFFF
jgi:hypothetical protein